MKVVWSILLSSSMTLSGFSAQGMYFRSYTNHSVGGVGPGSRAEGYCGFASRLIAKGEWGQIFEANLGLQIYLNSQNITAAQRL